MSYKRLLLVSSLVCGVVFWADSSQFSATASGAHTGHSAAKSAGRTLVMFKEKHKETYFNGQLKVKGLIAQVCTVRSGANLYRCPKGAAQTHVRVGVWTWWWPNGKKMAQQHYQFGFLKGRSTVWFSNGSLRWVEHYADGKLHGKRTLFYLKGGKKRVESYAEGKLNGTQVLFWSSGKTASTGGFKVGKRNGSWKSYYANGDLKEETQYTNGKKNGLYTLWRSICQPTGCAAIKSLAGQYKNGKKNGTWTRWFYNAEGKQERNEVNWKDGQKSF